MAMSTVVRVVSLAVSVSGSSGWRERLLSDFAPGASPVYTAMVANMSLPPLPTLAACTSNSSNCR